MKSYQGLKKDYWLFWVASSLGMGASNILQYVLSLYVLDLTGSATLFAVPVVKKYPANKLYFAAALTIAGGILMIGFCAVFGVYQIIPVAASVVLITLFDCVTIAAAIPMQMASSIMLQTGVEKGVLGRVSATLRMISIASSAADELLFGILNDATWVWLPIFLGAAGVALASLLFKRVMIVQEKTD